MRKQEPIKLQEGLRVRQGRIIATVKCFDRESVYVKFDDEVRIDEYTLDEFDECFESII